MNSTSYQSRKLNIVGDNHGSINMGNNNQGNISTISEVRNTGNCRSPQHGENIEHNTSRVPDPNSVGRLSSPTADNDIREHTGGSYQQGDSRGKTGTQPIETENQENLNDILTGNVERREVNIEGSNEASINVGDNNIGQLSTTYNKTT